MGVKGGREREGMEGGREREEGGRVNNIIIHPCAKRVNVA